VFIDSHHSFSRGVRGVSMACRALEQSERWRNVLDVGKLRVFRRNDAT
jgi:hypothetical protein